MGEALTAVSSNTCSAFVCLWRARLFNSGLGRAMMQSLVSCVGHVSNVQVVCFLSAREASERGPLLATPEASTEEACVIGSTHCKEVARCKYFRGRLCTEAVQGRKHPYIRHRWGMLSSCKWDSGVYGDVLFPMQGDILTCCVRLFGQIIQSIVLSESQNCKCVFV